MDNLTKAFEPKYKDVTGHEHPSLKEAEQTSQEYYDQIATKTPDKEYTELEKAYFDYLTTFYLNNKNLNPEDIFLQQEQILTYIKERYTAYLSELQREHSNSRNLKR